MGNGEKQALIDSILRGWRLPKFYFIKTSPEQFLVEDGQQRLLAIYDFCSNDLPLSQESAKQFGGRLYNDLPQAVADKFDDFEIEYDVIEDATEEELKDFFQRLQAGLPLTSSEKLNAVHGKLRDYVRSISRTPFFTETIAIANTRYAHFDIAAKVASIEIEGLQTGLRFEDIKAIFEAQAAFSGASAVAKRIRSALAFLHTAFGTKGTALRTRTVVQSLITLACEIIKTGHSAGLEKEIRKFFEAFNEELGKQIEMGQLASDSDYLIFQRSVNANVKGGAKTRHEVLLRKLFVFSPKLADIFDPTAIAKSGIAGRVPELADSISTLIGQLNRKYSANHGEDLFKATNKTAQALLRIRKPIKSIDDYRTLVDDLYFLFRESPGQRLGGTWPASFGDVNDLRLDLRHDIDHGDLKKVRSKNIRIGVAFSKYSGGGTPETIEPIRFSLVQANVLGAVEGDLRGLLATIS
jgi:hypothetical protein